MRLTNKERLNLAEANSPAAQPGGSWLTSTPGIPWLAPADWDSMVVVLVCAEVCAVANLRAILPYADLILLLAALLWCWFSRYRGQLRLADAGVLALLALHALWAFRDRSGLAIGPVAAAFRGMAVYWLMRTLRRPGPAARAIGVTLGVAAAMLSLFAIEDVHRWVAAVLGAGFTDVMALKAGMPSPLRTLVNEWATILLLCLVLQVAAIRIPAGWESVSNILCALSACLTASALFLTFSRGAYLALASFLLGLLCFGVWRRSRRVLALAAVLTVGVGAGALCMNALSAGSVAATSAMHSTEQQRRSGRGRLEVWSNAIELAAAHPVLGAGPGRFAMRYLPKARTAEGRQFIGRPLNSGLTILIEEGIAGLALYLFVTASAGWAALRDLLRLRACRAWPAAAALAGIGALAVREAAFSSLLENRTVTMLYWVLLGLAMSSLRPRSRAQAGRPITVPIRVALSALVVFAGFVFVREHRCGQAADFASRASIEIKSGNFADAVPLADQAIAIDPSAYHFSVRALARAAAHMPRFAIESPAPAVQSEQDRSALRAALADFSRAAEGNSDDDLFPHNRAWIRLSLGEPLAAVRADIGRSMQIDGAAPEYHVALGLIEERGGDRPGAVHEYGAALSFAPEIVDSQFAADLKTRDPEMWRASLAEAISRLRARNPDGQDVANQAAVARILIEQGDLDKARRMLERVTAAMPQFSRAWANLGYLESAAGDSAGAEQSLRKALFLDGAFCPARMLLARIEREFGDDDAAANLEGMCADGGRPPVSQHARRISRIYRAPGAVAGDDVLPPGLLAYCAPLKYPEAAQASVARLAK